MNAANFLEKTHADSEQSNDMYTRQDAKLDVVLDIAMAQKDVGGLLEGAKGSASLDAYEQTLDEIEEDIETKAEEAMDDNETVTEQTSGDQVATDSENQTAADSDGQATTDAEGQVITDAEGQVVAGAEGQVDIETKSQDNIKEQSVGTENTSNAKPAKQSVDVYV